MTAGPGAPGAPPAFTDEELAWMEAHLSALRRSWSGERFRYRVLGIAVVVGLAAHVGGYLLRASAPTELLGLLGDLLYTLGWGLWTGAVVVVLLQLYPEAKRRQVLQALDAYEAALRAKARAGRDQTAPDATRQRRTTERCRHESSPADLLVRLVYCSGTRYALQRGRDPGTG